MHIIVARFEEDLSWVKTVVPYASVTVYDKSGGKAPSMPQNVRYSRLPNVGREAQSFLHHVVSTYATLEGPLMFLQGNPFQHNVTPARLRAVVQGGRMEGFFTTVNPAPMLVCDCNGNPHHPGLNLSRLYTDIFAKPPPNYYYFSPGAQYIVSSAAILQKPLSFWKSLYKKSFAEQFAWEIERLWPHIFLGG
jgi:hypothetical protein